MNIEKIIEYIKANIQPRLVPPYVSKAYTDEDKESLYRGIHIALLKSNEQFDELTVFEIFDAMNPEIASDMKFACRRGTVSFNIPNPSKQGLVELLKWSKDTFDSSFPTFELSTELAPRHLFKSIYHMFDEFGATTNEDLAEQLVKITQEKGSKLTYIPPFDILNSLLDRVTLTPAEQVLSKRYGETPCRDIVEPNLSKTIDEFNKIEKPSLTDIARFTKTMLMLHPFPNGNGRTFTLGVLNHLLFKHQFGICIAMNPNIATLSADEIVQLITTHLIPYEKLDFDAHADTRVEANASTLGLFSKNGGSSRQVERDDKGLSTANTADETFDLAALQIA